MLFTMALHNNFFEEATTRETHYLFIFLVPWSNPVPRDQFGPYDPDHEGHPLLLLVFLAFFCFRCLSGLGLFLGQTILLEMSNKLPIMVRTTGVVKETILIPAASATTHSCGSCIWDKGTWGSRRL
mmetsp:Transcript_10119/g.18472  ORF Transcript_10119/g.18472 Transcript_10119/m.18472 type:complete len:126 (+) Transcript_10119:765-1142(+)